MTLEEAIKHAEEVAKEQEELYRLCPASESEMSHCDGTEDCKTLENGKNKGCQKCAEEHKQLAEWLKDYKRLLEQQPCEDCISRQAAIDESFEVDTKEYGRIEVVGVDAINSLPPVNPQPKTGHWIKIFLTDTSDIDGQCSECGFIHKFIDGHTAQYNYCPECGAKMVEPQESEEV